MNSRRVTSRPSTQHLLDNFTGHIGEAEVSSLMPVRQLQMVKAEAVKDGRVQVVNVHLVFHYSHSEVVRLTDRQTGLDLRRPAAS